MKILKTLNNQHTSKDQLIRQTQQSYNYNYAERITIQ